jgi:hypothetical protein
MCKVTYGFAGNFLLQIKCHIHNSFIDKSIDVVIK